MYLTLLLWCDRSTWGAGTRPSWRGTRSRMLCRTRNHFQGEQHLHPPPSLQGYVHVQEPPRPPRYHWRTAYLNRGGLNHVKKLKYQNFHFCSSLESQWCPFQITLILRNNKFEKICQFSISFRITQKISPFKVKI